MYIANQIIPKCLAIEVAKIYSTMQDHGCMVRSCLEQDDIVTLLKIAKCSPFPKVQNAFTQFVTATREEGMLHLLRKTGILSAVSSPSKTSKRKFQTVSVDKCNELQCDYDICSVA